MKIRIDESYPGEIKEKGAAIVQAVHKALSNRGVDIQEHQCGCGGNCGCHADTMSKAISDMQREDSPFKLIRELNLKARATAQSASDAAIIDISRYLTNRSIRVGDLS